MLLRTRAWMDRSLPITGWIPRSVQESRTCSFFKITYKLTSYHINTKFLWVIIIIIVGLNVSNVELKKVHKTFPMVLVSSIVISSVNCSSHQGQGENNQFEIFRKITLTDNNSMVLGQGISVMEELLNPTTEGYSLKPGTFGRADSITLYTTTGGTIWAIHTYYTDGMTRSEKAEDYSVKFFHDTPHKLQFSTAKIEYWQDAQSVFAIIEISGNLATKVFSSLCDKTQFKSYLHDIRSTGELSKDLQSSVKMMSAVLK